MKPLAAIGSRQTSGLGIASLSFTLALALAAAGAPADTVDITADTNVSSGYSGTAANPLALNFNGGRIVNQTPWNARLIGDYVTLRGVNGNDIVIAVGDWRPFKIGGVNTATAGDCDFKLIGVTDPGTVENNYLAIMTNSVAWGHTGDIVIENAMLRIEGVKADMIDSLPYGPGHGGLIVSTGDFALGKYGRVGKLNLYQRSQRLNWLDASHGGMVTNSLAGESRSATLTFGTGDVDGYVKGPIGGNVHVNKTGSGALALHDSSMPDLTVEDGSVSVVGVSSVAGPLSAKTGTGITVGNGGTLTVGGMIATTLEPVTDEADYFFGRNGTGSIAKVLALAGAGKSVAVEIAEGGTLEFGCAADMWVERMAVTNAGTIRKVGAGDCTVSGSVVQKLGGTIHVAGGSLAFTGVGNTNEWWKLVVTKNADTSGKLHFGQFGLFDEDGNKLWSSMSISEDADIASLANGSGTFSTPAGWSYDAGNDPSKLFTGNWFDYLEVSGMAAQQDQSARPFEVAFRLPAGANPAAFFSISATDGSGPVEFHVESSPTGADGSWTTVGAGRWTPDWNHYYYWLGDGSWGGLCGMPWRIDSNIPETIDVSGATLRVDAGATLDLSHTTGALEALEVDWTSLGGTIRNLDIRNGGVLRLVNVPAGTDVTGTPLLAVENYTGKENLKTWTLTVDGSPKSCYVQIGAQGSVVLAPTGTVIIVR